jgi:hypothetical protein
LRGAEDDGQALPLSLSTGRSTRTLKSGECVIRSPANMLDLRILRDQWTEAGGREVFAQLVTLCVQSIYPLARAVRPDPGDDGIDTFIGEFGADIKVYQSKFFCDGIGKSQKAQIRESWKRCRASKHATRLKLWTLCVPIELSTAEEKWWQDWRRKESASSGVAIELWTKPQFIRFSRRADLERVFEGALKRGAGQYADHNEVITAMRGMASPHPIKGLPAYDYLKDAVFVRKLEVAGITKHRAPRTAFYNFELLRQAIQQGGTPDENAYLEDLQERIYDLWEGLFNAHRPNNLGQSLFTAVEEAMTREDFNRLATPLRAHLMHKKGGLHYWADVCEAGWTEDHASVVSDRKKPEGSK